MLIRVGISQPPFVPTPYWPHLQSRGVIRCSEVLMRMLPVRLQKMSPVAMGRMDLLAFSRDVMMLVVRKGLTGVGMLFSAMVLTM